MTAQKSRDISEYAYRRGAIALLDFLDAERNYRATELAYRQAVAAYVTVARAASPGGGSQEPALILNSPCLLGPQLCKIQTEIGLMNKTEVRARIEEIGIIPGVRVSTSGRCALRRRSGHRAGIPIAEITMTVPGAVDVISQLAKNLPDMVVGAGTVLDTETAQRCLDAGAKFLTSPGLVMEVVDFAVKNDVVVFPAL